MIITYEASFRAVDMDDAVVIATKRWREVTGKPDAELPWDSNMSITDAWDDREEEGKHVELRINTDYAKDAS